jgi:predicted NAD/FAD-binding protein
LFIEDHIIPMACALWSSPSETIAKFPAKYLVQFMHNHHMLQVNERPEWRVVRGGSSTYINRLEKKWKAEVRLNAGVQSVSRANGKAQIKTAAGLDEFDQVIFACHSDQALALLSDAGSVEREILGDLPYQENETVLHVDASVLPKNRKAWAAWNAYIPASRSKACTVSYCMNILQSVQSKDPFVVTLNRTADIAPDKIIARMRYQHPMYTHASVQAKTRRHEINGKNNTWFAGAYWGFGFHEDGLRSGVEVARALGTHW